MEEAKFIVRFILSHGVLGFLLIALLLIIHSPERAEKLNALIFLPLYRLCRWGAKKYIASEVGYQATVFLKRHIVGLFSDSTDVKVKVKWVSSAADPVLQKDGTIILRLKEENDQTRNALVATEAAMSQLVFPFLRASLQKQVRTAIDLAMLRKMADKLGKHAQAVFVKYFLDPQTASDNAILNLFSKLTELDRNGLLVPIFLQELEFLADGLYVSADHADKTEEVCRFLEYLLTVARRQLGEEIQLAYHSGEFHVGLILVAKTEMATTHGVAAYIYRLQQKLRDGCESIYLIAYPHAWRFFDRVISAIDNEERVLIKRQNVVEIATSDRARQSRAKVVLLRKNGLFTDAAFEQKLQDAGINVGDTIEGTVTDVSAGHCMVNVAGIAGHITRDNCSWQILDDCSEVLKLGQRSSFFVTKIDRAADEVQLSLRFPNRDPWKNSPVPKVGDRIDVDIVRDKGISYVCQTPDGLDVFLPKVEVSWFEQPLSSIKSLLGTRQRVLVYESTSENRLVKCSMRRLDEDPWPKIRKRYPTGTEFKAKVIEVTSDFVRVQLEESLTGKVPRECMIKAGFEYAEFDKNVIPGQVLEVLVTKVFHNRQYIRLDLKRNLQSQPEQTEPSAPARRRR